MQLRHAIEQDQEQDMGQVQKGEGADVTQATGADGNAIAIIGVEEMNEKVSIKEALKAEAILSKYKEQNKTELENKQEPPVIIDYNPSHFTDEGNATRFVSLHCRNIRYIPAWERWMVWNGKFWERKKSKQMTEYVREMTRNMRKSAEAMGKIKESAVLMEFAAKTESYPKMMACINIAENDPKIQAKPEDFDKDDLLINLQNGIYDMREKKFIPHDREKMLSMIANTSYDMDATAPCFENFIDFTLAGNKNIISYLQRFFGSCLSGEVREKQLVIAHGKMDAGKTTLTELIGDILGEYADSIPIASLASERKNSIPNDIAKLHNKRFVYSVEPEFGDKLSESFIKRLTGRDSIDARFLNQEWFRFKPKFKLLVACNNPPAIKHGGDSATWNRIKGVHFNVSVPKEMQDVSLPDKLRAELPGILNWLITGCLIWQKEGMNEPQEVKIATAEYKETQDKYSDFFNTCCLSVPKEEEDKRGVTPSNILYTVYKLWCEIADVYPVADTQFGYYLVNVKGLETKSPRDKTGRRYRGYRGIRIVDEILPAVLDMLNADSDDYNKKYITAKDAVRRVVNKFVDSEPDVCESSFFEQSIKIIKETWDKCNGYNHELAEPIKKIMRDSLTIHIPELDDENADKVITHYFKMRKWECLHDLKTETS